MRAANDLDAFGELVERYRGSIQRQCYSSVHDRDHAEDLAQETFIRAYLHLGQLADPTRFPNWLRKIASNACREFARSPARREVVWEELPEHAAPPDAAYPVSCSGLDALPPETRACVELFYNSEMSYAEIAVALGITVASVKSRLQRAKAVLREEMADMTGPKRSVFTERVLGRLEKLRSSSPEDRLRAARDIRTALAEDEVEKIVYGLMNDPKVWGRRDIYNFEEAMSCVKRYRSPRVRDALIHVLLNHRMEEVRLKAAGALAAQRDPEAIPSLREAMADPRNPKEVVGAAKSTIKFLEELEEPAESEEGHLRFRGDVERAANDRKTRVELLRRLKSALGDPDSGVRNQAIKALVELGDKRAVPALVKLLDDQVPGIRQAAAIALGELRSAASVPALVRALEEWTGRQEIQTLLIALHKIADRRALPALLRLLERTHNGNLIVMSESPIVDIVTADDLADLKRSVDAAASSGHVRFPQHLRGIWVSALAKAGDARHVQEIAAMLRAGEHDWKLFEALGRIGGDDAVVALKGYLYTDAGDAAIAALFNAGEPGRQVLREALQGDNVNVQLEVCRRIVFDGGDPGSAEILARLAETATDRKTKAYAKRAWVRSTVSEAARNARLANRVIIAEA